MSNAPEIDCPEGFTKNMNLLIIGQDYEKVSKTRNPDNPDEWGWNYAGIVGKFMGKDTNYYQKMSQRGIRYGKSDGSVFSTEPAYKFKPSYSQDPIVDTEATSFCYRRITPHRMNVTQVFEQGTNRSNAELRAYLESDQSLPRIEPRTPISGAPGHGPANLIAAFAGLNEPKTIPAKLRLVQQLTTKVTAAERKQRDANNLEQRLKQLLDQARLKKLAQGQILEKKRPGNRPPTPAYVNAARSFNAASKNFMKQDEALLKAKTASQEAAASHSAAVAALKAAHDDLEAATRVERMPATSLEAIKNAENVRGGRYRKTRVKRRSSKKTRRN